MCVRDLEWTALKFIMQGNHSHTDVKTSSVSQDQVLEQAVVTFMFTGVFVDESMHAKSSSKKRVKR